MAKKFICTVCGYIHEGDSAPEKCPLCKVPAEKFKEMEDAALTFVAEHEIGVAKGCDDEMIKDLNNHFMGECTEVGMYLAMSRQAGKRQRLKRQSTQLSLLSSLAMLYGTQRQTLRSA